MARILPQDAARDEPPHGLGDDEDPPEPPRLRVLRRLVTTLTVVLILGMIVIAGALVWRVTADSAPPTLTPVTAERIAVPEGQSITALGGDGASILVSTRDTDGRERLLIFNKSDGRLMTTVDIDRPRP